MLHVHDAGVLAYRPAWDLQLQFHEQVLAEMAAAASVKDVAGASVGDGLTSRAHGVLMLVEHPPVITIGRRTDAANNLLASPRLLAARGVEVVETDRGGDITFHGPGQLVAYPILPLNAYGLNLHSYMRLLEEAAIRTLATFGIDALRDPSPKPATGVWVRDPAATPSPPSALHSPHRLAKICALGIKVRRWVTLHGIALNVSTDLSYFDLINPCGLSRPVTSMQRLLRENTPPLAEVKTAMIRAFETLLVHGQR